MKISEIRELKTEELHSELERLRRRLFELRSQSVTEKLENPNQIKAAQKEIARILTILAQRGETQIEQKQHHLEKVGRMRH
jgi:large subunit ribosomal protein L29